MRRRSGRFWALLGKIAIGDWLTASSRCCAVPLEGQYPMLIGPTAVVGPIAFPLLQPEWVIVK
jgi:chromate transporter